MCEARLGGVAMLEADDSDRPDFRQWHLAAKLTSTVFRRSKTVTVANFVFCICSGPSLRRRMGAMKLSATIPVTTVIPRGRLQRAAKEMARTRLELELVAL